MMKGKLYIIPDEAQILEELFYREVEMDHMKEMKAFADKYKLDIKLPENSSEEGASMIALLGHLVVKTEDNSGLAICYVPEEVTDRQNMWIHTMEHDLAKYTMIGALSFSNQDGETKIKRIKGIDKIVQETDRKNIQFQKRKDEIYVGKKI